MEEVKAAVAAVVAGGAALVAIVKTQGKVLSKKAVAVFALASAAVAAAAVAIVDALK